MPRLNIYNKTGIKLEIRAGQRSGAGFAGNPTVTDVNNGNFVVYDTAAATKFLVTAAPKMQNTGIRAANFAPPGGLGGNKNIYVVVSGDHLEISDSDPNT